MTGNMIERIARTLCGLAGDPPDSEPDWEAFVPAARAVLQAIREPSVEMAEAGIEATAAGGAEVSVWRAMIDCALEEE